MFQGAKYFLRGARHTKVHLGNGNFETSRG